MTVLLNLEPRSAEASIKEPAVDFAGGTDGHGKCCCADNYTYIGTAC